MITPGGADASPALRAFAYNDDGSFYELTPNELAVKRAFVEGFHAARREDGHSIDPATAEVTSFIQELSCPYEIRRYFTNQQSSIGRAYFARSPGSSTWVWIGDLPDATREHLQKHGGAAPDFDLFDGQELAR